MGIYTISYLLYVWIIFFDDDFILTILLNKMKLKTNHSLLEQNKNNILKYFTISKYFFKFIKWSNLLKLKKTEFVLGKHLNHQSTKSALIIFYYHWLQISSEWLIIKEYILIYQTTMYEWSLATIRYYLFLYIYKNIENFPKFQLNSNLNSNKLQINFPFILILYIS